VIHTPSELPLRSAWVLDYSHEAEKLCKPGFIYALSTIGVVKVINGIVFSKTKIEISCIPSAKIVLCLLELIAVWYHLKSNYGRSNRDADTLALEKIDNVKNVSLIISKWSFIEGNAPEPTISSQM